MGWGRHLLTFQTEFLLPDNPPEVAAVIPIDEWEQRDSVMREAKQHFWLGHQTGEWEGPNRITQSVHRPAVRTTGVSGRIQMMKVRSAIVWQVTDLVLKNRR